MASVRRVRAALAKQRPSTLRDFGMLQLSEWRGGDPTSQAPHPKSTAPTGRAAIASPNTVQSARRGGEPSAEACTAERIRRSNAPHARQEQQGTMQPAAACQGHGSHTVSLWKKAALRVASSWEYTKKSYLRSTQERLKRMGGASTGVSPPSSLELLVLVSSSLSRPSLTTRARSRCLRRPPPAPSPWWSTAQPASYLLSRKGRRKGRRLIIC